MVLVHLHVHVSVHVHAAHHRCVGVCECVFMFMCIIAGLSGIRTVQYLNKKTNDAGTGLVPDQAKAVRHFFGPVPDCSY